jgi:CRISPR-associated protein (TIGR02584 family)
MKNILLAVTGLSPQVITETLFALHQSNQRVVAIHVITTRDGKELLFAHLIAGKSGHYYRYLEEYGIEASSIDFGPQNIHAVTDHHGLEIPDITSEYDNERLLTLCLDLAFRFTGQRDTAVFFSVAGGRKTMSSCLALAAQIYGRPQDRLYHVLVSPEFESTRDFYYPPKKPKTIELKDKNGESFYKDTQYAQVNLISIPFISIRDRLSGDLLKEPSDPATLILSLIKEDEYRLTVNLLAGKIIYKTHELDLMPARLALYAFFAIQKKNCTKDIDTCGTCIDCFLDIQAIYAKQDEITDLYRKLAGSRPLDEMSDTGITSLSADNFNSYKGKIKGELLRGFGPYALKDMEISSIGARPNTRYGLRMDKSRIEIVY